MIKVYFCGSIRGGRQLASNYGKIITMLQGHGKVLSEHLGDDNAIQAKDRILPDQTIHDRDMQWIVESDLLVAEVTIPSLGVGYEIGRAVELKKPVLCLFKAGSEQVLSAMIAGCKDVETHSYFKTEDLTKIIGQFISLHAPYRTS